MPKKLTLAQVARMARAKNAVVWDSLWPKEKREWVKRLNAERAAGRTKTPSAKLISLASIGLWPSSIGRYR
jgi:hypothetical protein